MRIGTQRGLSTSGKRVQHQNEKALTVFRYVDLYKAYSSILSEALKNLRNISARRRAEKEVPEVKAVLEKSTRTDVQQDETLLTRIERETLGEWEDKEKRLTVLESRVEDLVFILRDLAVHGIEDE